MKVVFDTNVLISSTLWDNSSAQKLLARLVQNNIKNHISVDVLNEYKEVLRRDFDYEHEKISEYINRILSFSELVEPVEKINYIIEDPDDNIILECAVEAQADYIVTYDKNLLRLIVFRNIKILTP